jgi:hypothetical protein
VEADQRHRGHAIVEQVIAELKDGPLAHLPSGRYAANAAWVSYAVIAFNLARAGAVAAGQAKARWTSLRTKIINVPARIAATGRRLILHLPTHWPWASGWTQLGSQRPGHQPRAPDHQPDRARPRTPVEEPGRPATPQRPPPKEATRNCHQELRRRIRAE